MVGGISILHDTVLLKLGCDVLLYGLDCIELDYSMYNAQNVDEAIMSRLNTTLHLVWRQLSNALSTSDIQHVLDYQCLHSA